MYDTEMILGFMVHIEEGMDAYHSTWRNTLTRDIERVIEAIPGPALEIVKDTRIYLHKKYKYPGKSDSDGAAVSHNCQICQILKLSGFLWIIFKILHCGKKNLELGQKR